MQIVSNVFNLSHAIVRCGAATTPEELSVDILVEGRSDPRNGSQGQDIASKLAQVILTTHCDTLSDPTCSLESKSFMLERSYYDFSL